MPFFMDLFPRHCNMITLTEKYIKKILNTIKLTSKVQVIHKEGLAETHLELLPSPHKIKVIVPTLYSMQFQNVI